MRAGWKLERQLASLSGETMVVWRFHPHRTVTSVLCDL
jgi:hypothetical protein